MNFLEEKILKDGIVKEGNVLKVDSFLNHQMDIDLFNEMGKEWKKRFEGKNINKILTIEASGIGIACIVAQHFGCVLNGRNHDGSAEGADKAIHAGSLPNESAAGNQSASAKGADGQRYFTGSQNTGFQAFGKKHIYSARFSYRECTELSYQGAGSDIWNSCY